MKCKNCGHELSEKQIARNALACSGSCAQKLIAQRPGVKEKRSASLRKTLSHPKYRKSETKSLATKSVWERRTEEEKRKISEKISVSVSESQYRGWKEKEDVIRTLFQQKKSVPEIAKVIDYQSDAVYKALRHFDLNCSDLTESGTSEAENIIASILSDSGYEFIQRDRALLGNLEIDFIIPELKLGIEFNGSYWHSTKFKDERYHQTKTNRVEDLRYRLIHLYEHDNAEKNIRFLRNILKRDVKAIGARDTELVDLSVDEAKDFHNLHHFDGFRGASVHRALIHQSEVVCCASLTHRKNASELIRFSSSKRVLGGLNKILKNSEHTNLFSFANRSRTYRHHNIYTSTGWIEESVTPPNYVYVKYKQKLSRQQAMKHKLKDICENFDPSLTEKENMENHGWRRICDSGQIKYKYSYDNQ